MRDSILLVDRIQELGYGRNAVAAYEKEMFGIAASIIEQSNLSGRLFFEWDAPKNFVREMKKFEFIGATDTE